MCLDANLHFQPTSQYFKVNFHLILIADEQFSSLHHLLIPHELPKRNFNIYLFCYWSLRTQQANFDGFLLLRLAASYFLLILSRIRTFSTNEEFGFFLIQTSTG